MYMTDTVHPDSTEALYTRRSRTIAQLVCIGDRCVSVDTHKSLTVEQREPPRIKACSRVRLESRTNVPSYSPHTLPVAETHRSRPWLTPVLSLAWSSSRATAIALSSSKIRSPTTRPKPS